MLAATQNNIASNTGGNVGAALSGMLKAQRVGGTNINESLSRSRQLVPQLLGAKTGLENHMAQRKLELQMRKQNQIKAEAEALKKEGYQNTMGSIEGFFGGSSTNKVGSGKTKDEEVMDLNNPGMVSQMMGGITGAIGK